jgi:hypothetical protein
MTIKVLSVNYDSSPPQILGSLSVLEGEMLSNDTVFQSKEIRGCWKIGEFGYGGSPGGKSLVALLEARESERLPVGISLESMVTAETAGQ